jgi:hypothetical protein
LLVADICYPQRFYILLSLVLEYIKYETNPKPVCLFYLYLRIYFLQYVVKRNNITPRTIAIRFIEVKTRVMHENSKDVNLARMKDIVLE